MPEQIITKRCGDCEEIKPISEFYKDKSKKDKHSNQCKICKKQYQKSYSQSKKGEIVHKRAVWKYDHSEHGKTKHRRYYQSKRGKFICKLATQRGKTKYPDRYKARYTVNNAIRDGKLPRPDTLKCHYCPEQAEQYHHHKGYAKKHWLDVVPICIKCHN